MDKNGFKEWAKNAAAGYVSGKPEDIAKFDPKAAELFTKFNLARTELSLYVNARINKDNN